MATVTWDLRRELESQRRGALGEAERIVAQAGGLPLPLNARSQLETALGDAERAEARLGLLDTREERGRVKVRSEAPVYRPDGDHSFFADLALRGYKRDLEAGARLDRHAAQTMERRDAGTAAFGNLVPPGFVVDALAETPRLSRVLADLVVRAPLPPEGVEVRIPRFTAGPVAAIQAAENTAISQADATVADLTVPVRTVAVGQNLSFQLIERTSPPIDIVLAADLLSAYGDALEAQLVNGSGAAGQILGVLNVVGITTVTYTDASPTVGEMQPKVAEAHAGVAVARKKPAEVVLMHPRRWAWITGAVDTANRPQVAPDVNVRPAGPAEGPVGSFAGLPAYLSSGVPANLGAGANEDRIIVCRPSDLFLWEGPIVFNVHREARAGALGVVVELHRYAAFASGRQPTGIGVVTGSGLVTPAFP